MKGVAVALLNRVLGEHTEGISAEDFLPSLGDLRLENIRLKPNDLAGAPFRLHSGHISSINISSPWKSLLSDSFLIEISDVVVVLGTKEIDSALLRDWDRAQKLRRIADLEARLRGAESANGTAIDKIINLALSKVEVSVNNIHIVLRGATADGNHYTLGWVLESAIVDSPRGAPSLSTVIKNIVTKGMGLYFDIHGDERTPDPHAVRRPEREAFIIDSLDISAEVQRNIGSQNHRIDAEISVPKLSVQYAQSIHTVLLSEFSNYSYLLKRLRYEKFDPPEEEIGPRSARAWWKYLYRCGSDKIKQERGFIYRGQASRAVANIRRYTRLWLESGDATAEIAQLEAELPETIVVLCRRVAESQKASRGLWSFFSKPEAPGATFRREVSRIYAALNSSQRSPDLNLKAVVRDFALSIKDLTKIAGENFQIEFTSCFENPSRAKISLPTLEILNTTTSPARPVLSQRVPGGSLLTTEISNSTEKTRIDVKVAPLEFAADPVFLAGLSDFAGSIDGSPTLDHKALSGRPLKEIKDIISKTKAYDLRVEIEEPAVLVQSESAGAIQICLKRIKVRSHFDNVSLPGSVDEIYENPIKYVYPRIRVYFEALRVVFREKSADPLPNEAEILHIPATAMILYPCIIEDRHIKSVVANASIPSVKLSASIREVLGIAKIAASMNFPSTESDESSASLSFYVHAKVRSISTAVRLDKSDLVRASVDAIAIDGDEEHLVIGIESLAARFHDSDNSLLSVTGLRSDVYIENGTAATSVQKIESSVVPEVFNRHVNAVITELNGIDFGYLAGSPEPPSEQQVSTLTAASFSVEAASVTIKNAAEINVKKIDVNSSSVLVESIALNVADIPALYLDGLNFGFAGESTIDSMLITYSRLNISKFIDKMTLMFAFNEMTFLGAFSEGETEDNATTSSNHFTLKSIWLELPESMSADTSSVIISGSDVDLVATTDSIGVSVEGVKIYLRVEKSDTYNLNPLLDAKEISAISEETSIHVEYDLAGSRAVVVVPDLSFRLDKPEYDFFVQTLTRNFSEPSREGFPTYSGDKETGEEVLDMEFVVRIGRLSITGLNLKFGGHPDLFCLALEKQTEVKLAFYTSDRAILTIDGECLRLTDLLSKGSRRDVLLMKDEIKFELVMNPVDPRDIERFDMDIEVPSTTISMHWEAFFSAVDFFVPYFRYTWEDRPLPILPEWETDMMIRIFGGPVSIDMPKDHSAGGSPYSIQLMFSYVLFQIAFVNDDGMVMFGMFDLHKAFKQRGKGERLVLMEGVNLGMEIHLYETMRLRVAPLGPVDTTKPITMRGWNSLMTDNVSTEDVILRLTLYDVSPISDIFSAAGAAAGGASQSLEKIVIKDTFVIPPSIYKMRVTFPSIKIVLRGRVSEKNSFDLDYGRDLFIVSVQDLAVKAKTIDNDTSDPDLTASISAEPQLLFFNSRLNYWEESVERFSMSLHLDFEKNPDAKVRGTLTRLAINLTEDLYKLFLPEDGDEISLNVDEQNTFYVVNETSVAMDFAHRDGKVLVPPCGKHLISNAQVLDNSGFQFSLERTSQTLTLHPRVDLDVYSVLDERGVQRTLFSAWIKSRGRRDLVVHSNLVFRNTLERSDISFEISWDSVSLGVLDQTNRTVSAPYDWDPKSVISVRVKTKGAGWSPAKFVAYKVTEFSLDNPWSTLHESEEFKICPKSGMNFAGITHDGGKNSFLLRLKTEKIFHQARPHPLYVYEICSEFRLTNGLPINVKWQCANKKDESLKSSGILPPSESAEILNSGLSFGGDDLELSVTIGSLKMGPISLHRLRRDAVNSFRIHENLSLRIYVQGTEGIDLFLYVDYWIVNLTGLGLKIKDSFRIKGSKISFDSGFPVNSSQFLKYARSSDLYLSSKKSVEMSYLDTKFQKKVRLDLVGAMRVLSAKGLSLLISQTTFTVGKSLVSVLSPHLYIFNETSRRISVLIDGTDYRGQVSLVNVDPGDYSPLYQFRERNDRNVLYIKFDSPASVARYPLAVDTVGTFFYKTYWEGGGEFVFRVNIKNLENVYHVNVSQHWGDEFFDRESCRGNPFASTKGAIIVHNETEHPVRYYQDGLEGEPYSLSPGKTREYFWDDMMRPTLLRFEVSLDQPDGPASCVFAVRSQARKECGESCEIVSVLDASLYHVSVVPRSKRFSADHRKKRRYIKSFMSVSILELEASIINSIPEEVLLVSMGLINFTMDQSESDVSIDFIIGSLQADNMLKKQLYPVAISQPVPVSDQSPRVPPFFTFHLTQHSYEADRGLQGIESLAVGVSPVVVQLDDYLLITLVNFLSNRTVPRNYLISDRVDESLNALRGILDSSKRVDKSLLFPLPEPEDLKIQRHDMLYIELLVLTDLKIYLSFDTIPNHGRPLRTGDAGETMLRLHGSSLLSFNDVYLNYKGFRVNDSFIGKKELLSSLEDHYKGNVLNIALLLLGKGSVLGSPISSLSNIGSGMNKIFIDAMTTASREAKGEILERMQEDTELIVKGAFDTIFGSASQMAGLLGSSTAALSMDEEYQSRRKLQLMRDRPMSTGGGFKKGGKLLTRSFSSGIAGIVSQPVKGAKSGGFSGMLKGFGKGIIGAVAKPISGVADFTNSVVEGVKNEVTMDELQGGFRKVVRRKRRARHFRDGVYLCAYDREMSKFRDEFLEVGNILQTWGETEYIKSFVRGLDGFDNRYVVLTNVRLVYVRNRSVKLEVKIENVKRFEFDGKETLLIHLKGSKRAAKLVLKDVRRVLEMLKEELADMQIDDDQQTIGQ